MGANEKTPAQPDAGPSQWPGWNILAKKIILWALFLGLLYLIREFFFVAFVTFLVCYLTLGIVDQAMKRLAPKQDRPGLRRLLTIAVFLLVPAGLIGIGVVVAPTVVSQAQQVAGWVGHVNPETEVSRVLAGYVGPAEFKDKYGDANDPRFQQALEEFRNSGESHVAAYNDFPKLEAWVEGGFSNQYFAAERGRIRARLLHEGTSSKEFDQWFLDQKAPQLKEQAGRPPSTLTSPASAGGSKESKSTGSAAESAAVLTRAAASESPQQLLARVRSNPAMLADFREQWIQSTLTQELATARQSPNYLKQFGEYYNKQREHDPRTIPYTFEQYLELEKVRPNGRKAFGEALEKISPTSAADKEAQLRSDFEAAKKQELFHEWWGSSNVAKFIRRHVEASDSGETSARVERFVSSLLGVPADLATALILSFFICIDFPPLRHAARRLRETWLREAYDEFVPAFSGLGQLIGRSMQAQGLVSLCNATTMFLALSFLGVAHAALLSFVIFILCLVPTLGMILAWVLVAVVAVVQPGGGIVLALKVSGAVLVTVLLETFVFGPRLLGKMMELHPVMMIALLPIAQYFFGVWGLILATPVAVYVIHAVILQRGLPGTAAAVEQHNGH